MNGPASERRWFFGPLPDLLFGAGLAYVAVFALQVVAGAELRTAVPLGAIALGGLLTGTPHYGATLLRVYETRTERRTYAIFALWASVAIAALFVGGLFVPTIGALFFTLYLTWSPWHYTGQNYGIALLFLRRRGIEPDPETRRWLYMSFVCSYGLVAVSVHGLAQGIAYAPAGGNAGPIAFLSLGIPADLRDGLLAALAIASLVSGGLAARGVLRLGTPGAAGPAALVWGSQYLWFAAPVLSRATGIWGGVDPFSQEHAVYSFLFVAYAHALQYLWVTTWFARRQGTAARVPGYWLRCVLAGSAIWGLPALVFAPRALGPLPYDEGLYALIAAAVNVHHFVLDGAIWKLRDGRIARILLRRPEEADSAPRPGRGLLARGVLAAGALCALVFLAAGSAWHFGVTAGLRAGDPERVQRASQRLARVGQESALVELELARLWAARGRLAEARAALEASLRVRARAAAWSGLASLHAREGATAAAEAAFRSALALEPEHPAALFGLGALQLEHGRPREALPLLERAAALAPGDALLQQLLQRARALAGHS